MTEFEQRKNSSFNTWLIAAFALLIGLGLGGSSDVLRNFITDKVNNVQSGPLVNQDFKLYWDVYQKLQGQYVDTSKLGQSTLYYGSIKGMVDAIGDPATLFLDPKETADYNKSRGGNYSGIGAELDYVNKAVVVVAPFEGSPAEKAGIEAGDYIVEVDGKSVAYKTLTEVVSLIRGDAGTQVKIAVSRPRLSGRRFDFTITRGDISAPSMSVQSIKDGVAVVRINRFTENSLGEWQSKWDAIAQQLQAKVGSGEVKSLVLDLRGNPGGFFDAAVILASDFLPKNSVVAYQRDRSNKDESFSTSTSAPRFPTIPMVILVNGSSASASEIFAGALQYYKRATIIGENSYGKGTAQIILPLSDGSSLHVTVSKWLLPDKRWISHESPIVPDQEVHFDYDAKDKGIDNQLDAAIKAVKALKP